LSQAPPGWRQIRAKYLYRVVDERAGHESLPLLAVSIHHGVVPRDSLTDDEPRADDLSGYKRCALGDVVINRMRAFQGAVGVAPQPGIVSPDYVVLRMVDGVDVRYFHHLFRSTWFVGEMTARLRGIGSSDQGNVRTPRINVDDFGEIRVSIPSLNEQREIARFLDQETARIDALIESRQRVIHLLDERRRSVRA
jgi:type I restriction enzyme S subunit